MLENMVNIIVGRWRGEEMSNNEHKSLFTAKDRQKGLMEKSSPT